MTDVKPSRILKAISRAETPITELCLDAIRIKTLSPTDSAALSHHALDIEFLALNQTKLLNFDNFPVFANCECLEFHDNPTLPSELAKIPTFFPRLQELSLAGCTNLLALPDLDFVAFLPDLQILNLDPCPLTEMTPTYRSPIFEKLPNLLKIDRLNRQGEEVPSDDEEDEQAQEWIREFYDSVKTGDEIQDDPHEYQPSRGN